MFFLTKSVGDGAVVVITSTLEFFFHVFILLYFCLYIIIAITSIELKTIVGVIFLLVWSVFISSIKNFVDIRPPKKASNVGNTRTLRVKNEFVVPSFFFVVLYLTLLSALYIGIPLFLILFPLLALY